MRRCSAALTCSVAVEESVLRFVALAGLICIGACAAHAQAPAPAAPAPPAPDAPCALMSKIGDQYLTTPLAGFNPAITSVPLPTPPANAASTIVMCNRATIVPEITDYRVPLEMHLPLAIKAGDKSLFLGINKGKLQLGVPDGQSSAEEMQSLRARVDEMDLAMAKAAGVTAKK